MQPFATANLLEVVPAELLDEQNEETSYICNTLSSCKVNWVLASLRGRNQNVSTELLHFYKPLTRHQHFPNVPLHVRVMWNFNESPLWNAIRCSAFAFNADERDSSISHSRREYEEFHSVHEIIKIVCGGFLWAANPPAHRDALQTMAFCCE